MKLKITQNNLKTLTKIGLFICVVAVIVKLYPTKDTFKYTFEVGRPWKYELITASFDFPIYKDPQQIEQERIEILQNYTPYFTIDTKSGAKQLDLLVKKNIEARHLNDKQISYVTESLNSIYNTGIVSVDQYNELEKQKYDKICIINENRITHTVALNKLYTPKSAYEEIIKKSPFFAERSIKAIDLNLFLESNLSYDSLTSISIQNELLKGLSETYGMVQTGERIIDRGEIVSEHTYQILNSLKIAYTAQQTTIQQSTLTILGEVIFVILFITLLVLYLYLFRPVIYNNLSHLLFFALLILFMVMLSAMTIKHTSLSIYIVPFAWLPIIIRVFFDSRTALFIHLVAVMIISFMTPVPFEFIILQVAVGMIAVSSLKDMTQRAQLAQTALWIFATYCVGYVAFTFVVEGEINKMQWAQFVYFATSSLMILFAYGLIYVFEKLFGLISSITLIELTNVNSDLMIKFAEVAPGTFQHSLQVSNLGTEAAKKINANSLLVRTGALYHDIGKMANPEMFIENQQGGKNPLLDLDEESAARVIVNHVVEGLKIAQKQALPSIIISFITTHHGTSKTKFFYNTFLNKYPDRKPDEAAFTYPGPLPNSKETAILMMADAVEARSRSLNEYTEESIDAMVESMINEQIASGMFKDAPITFRDIETVKTVFKEKIKSMQHHRIVYPEVKKQTDKQATD